MFLNEIEGRHGEVGETEKQWICENLEKLKENEKLNILRELDNYKVITLKVLKEVYVTVTGKKVKGYFWAVCLECGCEYDYNLPMCPDCYDKQLMCKSKAIKTSEFQLPMKVIRYNKQYLNGDKGEITCYNCVHKKHNYCSNFGRANWNCKREEFEACNCSRCCSLAKKANAELEQDRQENKFSYAVPLQGVK